MTVAKRKVFTSSYSNQIIQQQKFGKVTIPFQRPSAAYDYAIYVDTL